MEGEGGADAGGKIGIYAILRRKRKEKLLSGALYRFSEINKCGGDLGWRVNEVR